MYRTLRHRETSVDWIMDTPSKLPGSRPAWRVQDCIPAACQMRREWPKCILCGQLSEITGDE